MAFRSPGRTLSTWRASARPQGRRSMPTRRRKSVTRRSWKIWTRREWWRWAKPISRNSPSRRLGSIRISARREIRVIPRRRALREAPRQAPRSRLPAALRLARSAATPAARSARPQSFCGIVGFKTSEGRIDKQGVFPLSRTLDTIGPMAHTVEDCVLIDMALRGQSNTSVRPLDLGGVEFVVPDKSGIDDVQPEVGANLETTMKRLAAAGAKVTSRPIPQIGAMRALSAQYGSFVAIEAYAEHRAIFDSADAQRMDRRVVKRALGGRVPERDALNLQRGREELIAALTDELKGAVLVLPATPMTAPAIDPLERDDELFRVTNLRAIHYTFLGNLFRMCGLALPSGTDAAGLPTGVQFLAPGGRRRTPSVDRAEYRESALALREASLSLIRHAPDRAAAVIADEQRAVSAPPRRRPGGPRRSCRRQRSRQENPHTRRSACRPSSRGARLCSRCAWRDSTSRAA